MHAAPGCHVLHFFRQACHSFLGGGMWPLLIASGVECMVLIDMLLCLSQSGRAAVVAVRRVAATCRTSLLCGTSSKPPGRSAWWCSVLHGRCLPVKRRMPAKLASLSHVEGRCITNLSAAAKRTTTVPFDSPLPRLVLAREVCLGSSDELCLLGSSLRQHVLPASLFQQKRSQIQCTMLTSDFQGVASCFACSVSAHGCHAALCKLLGTCT